ncbi:MAG TPA: hypothetical protein DEF45_00960 [Rhodopirellula sp.]|nr:MAG: hypothetical protein CBD74_07420 [Saprospirales bacterium TMED214]HBV61569.1 hypothetical protein [Rhodopirellula sp.]
MLGDDQRPKNHSNLIKPSADRKSGSCHSFGDSDQQNHTQSTHWVDCDTSDGSDIMSNFEGERSSLLQSQSQTTHFR